MKTNGTSRIADLEPCPDNASVYREVRPDDPAIRNLAADIRKLGLLEPIVITMDNVILSGHRRFAACRLAGLVEVPVRRLKVRYAEERDKCLRLLVSFNRQRVKNPAEQIREEAVAAANGEEAHRRLLAKRIEEAQEARLGKRSHDSVSGGIRRRAKVSRAKQAFLAASKAVLDDNRDYWPLSVRQVHYRLSEGSRPLIHSSKPASAFKNNKASYKALIKLCASARVEKLIPWEAISDDTRPAIIWKVNPHLGDYMAEQMKTLFDDYVRDPLQSQSGHIEILVEKNTVLSIVKNVAMRYRIPVMSCRGFSSLAPLDDLEERFHASGKAKLVVLAVSDFDPSGESIAKHILLTLRDDFMLPETRIDVRKVALTHRQVLERALPPGGKAKKGDSRTRGFVKRYGEDVFELEALEPSDLANIVDDAIRSVLDIKAFNRELEAERSECAALDARRRAALEVLKGFRT
jgi:ParB-like chromosome segregation protein Spo0J